MQDNLQDKVLEKIKKGEVSMTPRSFFILKWFTLAVAAMFFLLLAAYIFAYIIFLFVDNGLMIIPFEAEGGMIKFLIEIPWTLVFLGLISLFFFSIASRTFYKIYKKPLIYFYFTILICVILSHIILLETGTFKIIKEEAYRAGIKLVPAKLLQFRDSQTGSLYVGIVVATSSQQITIVNRYNQKQNLYFDNTNQELVFKIREISLGQKINAYAERGNEQIVIKSLKIID